jgi:hypothetical protein
VAGCSPAVATPRMPGQMSPAQRGRGDPRSLPFRKWYPVRESNSHSRFRRPRSGIRRTGHGRCTLSCGHATSRRRLRPPTRWRGMWSSRRESNSRNEASEAKRRIRRRDEMAAG